MIVERPDLTDIDEGVVAYITYLEQRLAAEQRPTGRSSSVTTTTTTTPVIPTEPETTIQVITWSQNGAIKRTPRHLYARQKRAGMGVFDIDLPEDDRPKQILLADVESDLIVITNFARIYKIAVADIQEAPVRGKGGAFVELLAGLGLHEREHVVTLLAGQGASIAILTERGHVVTRNKNFIRNGAILYDVNKILPPKAACWSTGRDDLFVGTKNGLVIRFAAGQVSSGGTSAIRLETGDRLLGITAVESDGGVLLVSSEGRGTIRLMDGFRPNKSPGGGGKVALKADEMVGMVSVNPENDVFIVSALCKMIRFNAGDIPPKTGAVQGVHLMTLRADVVAAVGVSG